MPFCINCGARNEANAVFCLSCGQTLYHGPKGPITKKIPWKRLPIFALIFSLVASCVVVTLVVRHNSGLGKSDSSASEEPRADPSFTDKAVLTIVGKSRSGADVSQGSGFVLTPDGLGATNYHVLEGATQAIAECCGQRTFDIRSIEGADIDKDLVVFQLVETGHLEKPQNLPHVILGSSKNSIVGEKVIAVGSPQGLENTVSDGILSAVREYDAVRLLQITAPISPGSSGGPVFDATGQVIGVSTFQFEKGQNLNFAVAAEYLGPLREQRLHVSLAQFQSSMRQYERQKSSAAQPPQRETSSESSQPARAPLRGMFSGVVHNLSANLSAGFVVLVEETDGVLSGCMGVKQPLFGSGPLSGSVEGAEVSFDVVSATGTITFTGHREGGKINGTYVVDHQGSASENGTFTLRRLDSKGLGQDFDSASCPTDAEMNQ